MYNLLCCCPAVLLWLYYYCTTVLLYYCASVLLYERPGSDGQQHLPITKRLSWIPDSRDETSHILQRVRSSCHNYFALSFGTKPQASHHAAIIVCHSKPTQPQTACISALKEGQNMQASPAPRTTCEPVTTQQCLSQQAVPRLTQTTCGTSNRVQHMQPRTVPPTASIHKLQPCHSAAAIIVGSARLMERYL